MREDSNPDWLANKPGSKQKRAATGCPFCCAVRSGGETLSLSALRLRGRAADAHAVERAVHENKGDDEECRCQDVRQAVAPLARGELHG
jgi:hypothetical protein